MSETHFDEDAELVDRVIGPGQPQRVGSFRYYLSEQRWEWAEAVAQMHGYSPGTMPPTTELLLKHKHPDDRERVTRAFDKILRGEPFSSRHRIIDTHGRTHWVVVVGDRLLADDGELLGASGFYIDVSDAMQSDLTEAVAEIAASRAEIEQAKGILMMFYRIDADRAFELLVWRSKETNTKVRDIAHQFMQAVTGIEFSAGTTQQIDRILINLPVAIPQQP